MMDGRRAGVFLGTVDEIDHNVYRVYVKVTNNSKKSNAELHSDLQIHHEGFGSPNSDIIINKELKSTKEMKFYDAKNASMKFVLVYYRPIVKRIQDYNEDGKDKKKNITLAQEYVINELSNTVQIRMNLATGKKSYDMDDFIKIYAHGRVFAKEGDKIIESDEITLDESSVDLDYIEDSLIKGDSGAFVPLVALARKLILLHMGGLIVGNPSLTNIKLADSKYKWNSPTLRIRHIPNDTHILVRNLLRCIDLCHLLFNNRYFLDQIGINDISRLEMWRILNRAPGEIRSVIVFSTDVMLKTLQITDQKSCIFILKESFHKLYNGEHIEMFDGILRGFYNINWTDVAAYLLNAVNMENLFTIAIRAHTEGKPVKKSNGNYGFEDYQNPFSTVRATPIVHDGGYVYTDSGGGKTLVFKNILHQTEFYEMDSDGNISEYILPETPVFLYADRGVVFTDKKSGSPIGFYYTDENLILEVELQNKSKKVISKYKFVHNTQILEFDEPIPVKSIPFGGYVGLRTNDYKTTQDVNPSSVIEVIRSQPEIQPAVHQPVVYYISPPPAANNQIVLHTPQNNGARLPLNYLQKQIQVQTKRGYQRVFFTFDVHGNYTLWVNSHVNGVYEQLQVSPLQSFAIDGMATNLFFSIDAINKNLNFFQQTPNGLMTIRQEPLWRYAS